MAYAQIAVKQHLSGGLAQPYRIDIISGLRGSSLGSQEMHRPAAASMQAPTAGTAIVLPARDTHESTKTETATRNSK